MILYAEEKPIVHTYEFNVVGRDFIIGDLHGEYKQLMSAMDAVSFNKTKDRLFSVGDLVDRGEDSWSCVKLIDEDWFYSVQGNHELLYSDAILGENLGTNLMMSNWVNNGGGWHKGLDYSQVVEYARKVIKLPHAITIGQGKNSIGICHANPPSGGDWDDVHDFKQIHTMQWSRTRIKNKHKHRIVNVGMTFHGHTPIHSPLTLGNTHFIDTGACFSGGHLTMQQIGGFDNE